MNWRNEVNKYTSWRKEVNKKLPDLSQRVFALRKGGYTGCGFHYDLEATLGKVIHMVNSSNEFPKELPDILLQEVIYEGLLDSIKKAESTFISYR